MHVVMDARNRLERGYSDKRLTLYFLIVPTLVLALVVASCGAIPSGKESDAVVKSFMTAAEAKDIDSAWWPFGSQ